MVKALILVLFIAVLAGCQSFVPKAEQAVSIVTKAAYVDEVVKSGAIVDSLFSSSLSKDEIETIKASLKAYNDFSDKWSGVIAKNPLEAMTQTSLIISEYGILRLRYQEIERIVVANWDKYTPENQYLLTEYGNQAKELDKMIMNLLSYSKTNTALLAIKRMAVVTGQIALKLI